MREIDLLNQYAQLQAQLYAHFWRPYALGFVLANILLLAFLAVCARSALRAAQVSREAVLETRRSAQASIDSLHLQSIGAILRFIEGRDISRARWFAYEHYPEINALLAQSFPTEFEKLRAVDAFIRTKSREELGKELDIREFSYPIVALNIVAYLIFKGQVGRDIVPEMLDSTFLRTWRAYHGFIRYRRTHRVPLYEETDQPGGKSLPATKYALYLEKVVMDITLNSNSSPPV